MADIEVNISSLASELAKALTDYTDKATDIIKKAIDETAKDTVKELKEKSPKRTGNYAKSWKKKDEYEDSRSKRVTIHNEKHYQITHLLEYGYKKTEGGDIVGKRPHIKEIEENAIKNFEERLRRELDGSI